MSAQHLLLKKDDRKIVLALCVRDGRTHRLEVCPIRQLGNQIWLLVESVR